MKPFAKHTLALGLMSILAACAGTDNTPEPKPLAELKNGIDIQSSWRVNVAGSSLYRFAPDVTGEAVYVGSPDGITGFASADGRKLTEVRSDKPLAGGVGASAGLIVAGTIKGEVFAWETDGSLRWGSRVSSEVVSPPVVSEGTVVVRSVDGKVWGMDAKDGKVRWQFQRSQPSLILRNYAPVAVVDGAVYVGLASGRLASLSLNDGRVLWESQVAQPKGASELERISDVTSAPVADRAAVCAVAFQGRVACFAPNNGTLLWARDVSSYAGLTMDADRVYVADEAGNVQAFDRTGGRNVWRQEALQGRRLSAPAVFDGRVVVGDFEGYVHFMSPADGNIIARMATDKSRVLVAPKVIAGKLMVQTESGNLHALTVN
ncbi:outer membrane protein assembly factor BamB [Chitinimonas sp. BJYL2]|uniref:outer membrane protein assembly factor BamB n=1 Tax=Chitinimonas sp. BJYL2 TaxID=2976696 RepID=UPI0022B3FF28|nr:outer membrane protein assembly factor BamB [Chitinimonas sp. BJYL2]